MIIVTGHMGFIGQHLVRALEAQGETVEGFDLKQGKDICADDLPKGASKVFHLAAQTNAQDGNVLDDARVNIAGTLHVLDQYADRVVFTSSVAVLHPITPYAISKRTAEDYCRLYGAAIVRLCNIYGEGGHGVRDIFAREETLTIRGEGNQRRSYAPVEKAVELLIAAEPGSLTRLHGDIMTVVDVADLYPSKPRRFEPATSTDIIDGIQPP
jgi:nucleoside-diphosphate-sugar epimerase